MKIALVFLVLLAMVVLGLPFSVRGDSSITGRVQSFLSYGLTASGALLGLLTVFVSRTLSDELAGRQIEIVMTKPVSRWEFVFGKWVGITLLNATFLTFATVSIYGMVHYIKRAYPPINDTFDEAELNNEILVARHAVPFTPPDFAQRAEAAFQQRLENGAYADAAQLDAAAEKARLDAQLSARWRTVGPDEARTFMFRSVLCDRRPDKVVQLRYKTEVFGYPPDEIFRARWVFGDPRKETSVYVVDRRDVVGRFHTIRVPADAVAPDNTLTATFINHNYTPGEPQFNNGIQFLERDRVELLFVVGSFEGNLLRAATLIMCKLMFLAAMALMWTTFLSFPVACLTSFTLYGMAAIKGFVLEGIDFALDDQTTALGSLKAVFAAIRDMNVQDVLNNAWQCVMIAGSWVVTILGAVVPDLSYYNPIDTIVVGRNVTLMWVLEGMTKLVGLHTLLLLGVAMLIFQFREVSSTSA